MADKMKRERERERETIQNVNSDDFPPQETVDTKVSLTGREFRRQL